MEKGQKVKLTKRSRLINAFDKIQVGDEMVFITEKWSEIKNIIKLNYEEKYYRYYMLFKFNDDFILMGSNRILKDFEVINEPQFKQGDMVLYTDDLANWEEGIFLVKHDESYIVESDEMLLYAIEIKPYKEEIKIGDWVFLNDERGVCKITDKHDLKEVNNSFTLLKNKKLIELLNNEL